MEKYNYLEAVTKAAKQWLIDNYKIEFLIIQKDYDKFYEEMFVEDSVTGNASGSYTCNTWEAEENLCHNWELIENANNELIGDEYPQISTSWKKSAEYWDVVIRIYLLRDAIEIAMNEIKEEYNKKENK